MTKKLEELFGLEDPNRVQRVKKTPPRQRKKDSEVAKDALAAARQVKSQLPSIRELRTLDDDGLEQLARKAEAAYDDLMDLGMNVDSRYSGRIFEVASSMMKNAIDAKNAKIDKQLKAIDLQLKKLKIDSDNRSKKGGNNDEDTIDGEGFVLTDRNELLRKLSEKD